MSDDNPTKLCNVCGEPMRDTRAMLALHGRKRDRGTRGPGAGQRLHRRPGQRLPVPPACVETIQVTDHDEEQIYGYSSQRSFRAAEKSEAYMKQADALWRVER